MEKSALAQEKVWFDKPSYDKAERLYFERMAKVVSQKIMGSCPVKSEVSVINNCPEISSNNPLSKSKSEKSKDNKLLISENSNENLKNSKCQTKASKTIKEENEYNKEKKECVEEKQKIDNIKNDVKEKEKETSPSSDGSKKYNIKEAKEKKNKADTRHRNKGKGKNDNKEVKENSNAPLIRNKQQLPNQMDDIAAVAGLATLNDNKKDNLEHVVEELRNIIVRLEKRVKALEDKVNQPSSEKCEKSAKSDPAPKQSNEKAEDDDVDLFGSDSEGEDAEAAKIREERLAAYAAKKSKKPVLVAKSNIILDVKPWGSDTDMKLMETEIRKIECDGLLWGAAKLVPLAFGIFKLQISCVVEDEKVSVDWLTDTIQEIEEHVQSVDIAAFNKI